MLIPYRNSVLTSIFRPFFVGRGRTIICCNVNPCATFITQTNDLLKFCALAQKVRLSTSQRTHQTHTCVSVRLSSYPVSPKRVLDSFGHSVNRRIKGPNVWEKMPFSVTRMQRTSLPTTTSKVSVNGMRKVYHGTLDRHPHTSGAFIFNMTMYFFRHSDGIYRRTTLNGSNEQQIGNDLSLVSRQFFVHLPSSRSTIGDFLQPKP